MPIPAIHPIPCVGVIVKNSKGEFLLGQRLGSHGASEWGLPGGKIEFGERVLDAALREVKEETGLEVRFDNIIGINDDLEWVSDNRQYLTVIIQATYTHGIPTVCEPDKCAQWRWYTYDSLPTNLFLPSKRALALAKEKTLYQPETVFKVV